MIKLEWAVIKSWAVLKINLKNEYVQPISHSPPHERINAFLMKKDTDCIKPETSEMLRKRFCTIVKVQNFFMFPAARVTIGSCRERKEAPARAYRRCTISVASFTCSTKFEVVCTGWESSTRKKPELIVHLRS